MVNYLTKEDMKKIAELDKKRAEEKRQKEVERKAKEIEKEARAKLDERKVKNGLWADDNIYATQNQIKGIVSEKIKWMQWGKEKGRPKTDEEVWKRIAEFWNIMAETGEIPHKTDFYTYMDIDINTASNWRNGKGCSKERQAMMNTFDMMYNSVRDDLADKNLINQVSWIWSSKQWQGYREPINKVEITQTTPLDSLPDIASVEAKYLSALPKEAFLNTPKDIDK